MNSSSLIIQPIWSQKEVEDFLEIFLKHKMIGQGMKFINKNHKIFKLIKSDMDKLGYVKKIEQLSSKFNNLIIRYQKSLKNDKIRGGFRFFNKMQELLSTDKIQTNDKNQVTDNYNNQLKTINNQDSQDSFIEINHNNGLRTFQTDHNYDQLPESYSDENINKGKYSFNDTAIKSKKISKKTYECSQNFATNYTDWSEKETEDFINICIKHKVLKKMKNRKYHLHDVFALVKSEMVELGYRKNITQMSVKLKRLRSCYKDALVNPEKYSNVGLLNKIKELIGNDGNNRKNYSHVNDHSYDQIPSSILEELSESDSEVDKDGIENKEDCTRLWKSQEVHNLIDICGKNEIFENLIQGNFRLDFYKVITAMEKLGYNKTLPQIKLKIKRLRQHYEKALKNEKFRQKFTYFKKMDEVLKDKLITKDDKKKSITSNSNENKSKEQKNTKRTTNCEFFENDHTYDQKSFLLAETNLINPDVCMDFLSNFGEFEIQEMNDLHEDQLQYCEQTQNIKCDNGENLTCNGVENLTCNGGENLTCNGSENLTVDDLPKCNCKDYLNVKEFLQSYKKIQEDLQKSYFEEQRKLQVQQQLFEEQMFQREQTFFSKMFSMYRNNNFE